MTHFYTTRAKFSKDSEVDPLTWTKYIEWSKLRHLTELVSVDKGLNEILVESDRSSEKDWEQIVIEEYYETGFFKTLDYVLQKTKDVKKFNLLSVVIEPETDCSLVQLDNYDFLGYDLLDTYFDISALTNCGGFDETFVPGDLNSVGLIDDFEKVYSLKVRLRENNPEEAHADTNVIAIWRHRTIGQ